MKLQAIQKYLQEHDINGWLLADFHGYNSVFVELLGIGNMLTRRSFFYIPAKGDATAIVHAIEQERFKSLEADLVTYSSYVQFESELRKLIKKGERIAMEYSPNGRLPYIAIVDAGTIELVRSCGADIVSSADIVSNFQARLDINKIATHRTAARNLFEIKDKAFSLISQRLKEKKAVTEFEISQFMLKQFDEYGMEADHPPNCSFAANAGNPHYEPSNEKTATLNEGEIVLIDLWAKLKVENAVFADICWIAYAGNKIPDRFEKKFAVIANARDKAIQFLRENISNRPVYGYEVDDVSRQSVVADGFGANFTHRTGHSITTTVHGNGPNIDNLETEDRRVLQEGHLFSIEPGVYFDDFGMRTEVDVLISDDGIELNPSPVQDEIITLL